MERFTIRKDSFIKATAYSGRAIFAVKYDDFSSISDCIQWAKNAAHYKGLNLTGIQITDLTNDACATYAPNGKRID